MLASHHPGDSREPEISIVIATYDRPIALARCLESLLLQSSKRSFEIIVVDNHPQSGLTAPLIDRFASVRWYTQPVRGPLAGEESWYRDRSGEPFLSQQTTM